MLALTGCASSRAPVFTPISTDALGARVDDTQKSVHSAKSQAEAIYQKGTPARSTEANQLRLTLATAESNAIQSQKALDDFKRATASQFQTINKTVARETARADTAEAKVAQIKPHLNRLRVFANIAYFAGGVLALLAPWLASITGYGAVISSIPILGKFINTAEGVAALIAGAALLNGFLWIAALFGYL